MNKDVLGGFQSKGMQINKQTMKKTYAISFSILFLVVIGLLFYQSSDLGVQDFGTQNEISLKDTQPQALKVSEANVNSISKQKITANTKTIKQPKENNYVFDREGLFSDFEYEQLNHKLTQYEKETTREVVVLTTNSISPYENIAEFALNTANEWGIGKAETNNGLFIVVSKQLQVMRINTGLGTEKVLTDEICQKVVDEQILPEFVQGKFYTGIDKGIDKLMFYWK